MSAPPDFPVEPPSNDKGVFTWDKISGTWKIMFPLLIVGGIIAGSVIFGGMVTFQNGITISNKQGIIYNGHFYNFTNNTGNILLNNGSGSSLTGIKLSSLNLNGHISTAPSNTGTICLINQTGSCGVGSPFTYNVTSTTTTPISVNTGSQVLLIDATAGNKVVNLPPSSGITTFITVIKTDSSVNTVTINRAGTDTIEGGTSKILSVQYSKVTLQSNNSNAWYDIGSGNQ